MTEKIVVPSEYVRLARIRAGVAEIDGTNHEPLNFHALPPQFEGKDMVFVLLPERSPLAYLWGTAAAAAALEDNMTIPAASEGPLGFNWWKPAGMAHDEAMAALQREIEEPSADAALEDLTRKELIALAEDRGLDVSKFRSKADIIAALTAEGTESAEITDGEEATEPEEGESSEAQEPQAEEEESAEEA